MAVKAIGKAKRLDEVHLFDRTPAGRAALDAVLRRRRSAGIRPAGHGSWTAPEERKAVAYLGPCVECRVAEEVPLAFFVEEVDSVEPPSGGVCVDCSPSWVLRQARIGRVVRAVRAKLGPREPWENERKLAALLAKIDGDEAELARWETKLGSTLPLPTG